jgi:secondary thiamine-phosphate synthase enzyme
MSAKTETLQVRTNERSQMIEVTGLVKRVVADSGVREGLAVVHVPHTTAAVTINENADPDVVHDVLATLDRMAPWDQEFYAHAEGNSSAHVKSSMIGCSQTILIDDGKMVLGTWQGIYFCEFDGPRTRNLLVRVMGD